MNTPCHVLLAGSLAAMIISAVPAAPQCPNMGPQARTGSARPILPGNPGGPKLTPNPAAPHTSAPSTPAPTTPGGRTRPPTQTGLPTGPTTPGRRASRTPRGPAMVFTRGRTSKKRLTIDWNVPVYVAEQLQHTGAGPVLSREQAFAFLREGDKRPLLVLRECHLCAGSDFALLNRATHNERTMLLTMWFHCVKLPSTVLRRDHALRNLFPGKNPPHLFFSTNDGKEIVTLPGSQTPSQVWKAMTKILRKTYKGDSTKAVKQLLSVLDGFDTLDAKLMELRRRLDTTLEKFGPASAKFKKLRSRFDMLQVDRNKLLSKERKLRELGIK